MVLKNPDVLRKLFFAHVAEGKPAYWTLWYDSSEKNHIATNNSVSDHQQSYAKLENLIAMHLNGAGKFKVRMRTAQQDNGSVFYFANDVDHEQVNMALNGGIPTTIGGMSNIGMFGSVIQSRDEVAALKTELAIQKMEYRNLQERAKRAVRAAKKEGESKGNKFTDAIAGMMETHGPQLLGPIIASFFPTPVPATIGEIDTNAAIPHKGDIAGDYHFDYNRPMIAVQMLMQHGYDKPDILLLRVAHWACSNKEQAQILLNNLPELP